MLRVNAGRLLADLEALGRIGRQESGGIFRTAFSPADVLAGSGTASAAPRPVSRSRSTASAT